MQAAFESHGKFVDIRQAGTEIERILIVLRNEQCCFEQGDMCIVLHQRDEVIIGFDHRQRAQLDSRLKSANRKPIKASAPK